MNLKFQLLTTFLFWSFASSAQTSGSFTLTTVGSTAPKFRVEVEKGVFKNLEDYKGKLVLINFFATWCPPCLQELPRMQKEVWEKYKDNPEFALLVIGREQGWEKLDAFKKTHNYTFSVLPDLQRTIFSKYATQDIPRNVLIDENGKIIYQSVGYVPEEFDKLLELIARKLN